MSTERFFASPADLAADLAQQPTDWWPPSREDAIRAMPEWASEIMSPEEYWLTDWRADLPPLEDWLTPVSPPTMPPTTLSVTKDGTTVALSSPSSSTMFFGVLTGVVGLAVGISIGLKIAENKPVPENDTHRRARNSARPSHR